MSTSTLRPAFLPTAPRAAATPLAAAVPRNGFAFLLFLALNAVAIVRPSEVFQELLGLEIYRYLLLVCVLLSFPTVLEKLNLRLLEQQPITLCVLALLPAVLLSLLSHLYLDDALIQGRNYCLILIYYFLFIALVDSPARVRTFLGWLAACAAVAAVLAILDYHGIRELPKPALRPAKDLAAPAPEEGVRMVGTGQFEDPNDLCVLLVTAMMLALYGLSDRRGGWLRGLWLLPLTLFAYGFFRTQSRGGLLTLVAGVGVLVRLRYGWGRTILLGCIGLPVLVGMLGSRQTAISVSTNTGQERIQLWSDGLMMFRGAPLFGVGVERYQDFASHVAHNAYLQAFSEMGLLGGGLFLGAFYLAVWPLFRLTAPPPALPGQATPPPREILDPELRDTYPFLAAAVAAYATGMLTLSLTYTLPTFMMLALATVFLSLARTRPASESVRFDFHLLARFAVLSIGFLLAMQVFVRLSFQS